MPQDNLYILKFVPTWWHLPHDKTLTDMNFKLEMRGEKNPERLVRKDLAPHISTSLAGEDGHLEVASHSSLLCQLFLSELEALWRRTCASVGNELSAAFNLTHLPI